MNCYGHETKVTVYHGLYEIIVQVTHSCGPKQKYFTSVLPTPVYQVSLPRGDHS